MKQIKVYPLAKASSPPAMEFMNGSRRDIDTVFPDNFRFFELLAMLVDEEPLESFGPLERFQMQAIGIEKGKAFNPDEKTKALLYRGRASRWRHRACQHICLRGAWGFLLSGSQMAARARRHDLHVHARKGFRKSMRATTFTTWPLATRPSMMEKNIGKGSQYLWTYRDADGDFLDGAKN